MGHILRIIFACLLLSCALPIIAQEKNAERPWKGFPRNLASRLYDSKEIKRVFNLKQNPRFTPDTAEGARYTSAGFYRAEKGYFHIALYGTDDDAQAEKIFYEAFKEAAHSTPLEGIGRKCVAVVVKDPPKPKDGKGEEDKGNSKKSGPGAREPEEEKKIVFLNDVRPVVGILSVHEGMGTLQHLVLLAKSANWRINKL
jgi:hypothetical protein